MKHAVYDLVIWYTHTHTHPHTHAHYVRTHIFYITITDLEFYCSN